MKFRIILYTYVFNIHVYIHIYIYCLGSLTGIICSLPCVVGTEVKCLERDPGGVLSQSCLFIETHDATRFPTSVLKCYCLNWRKVLGKGFVELWGRELRFGGKIVGQLWARTCCKVVAKLYQQSKNYQPTY